MVEENSIPQQDSTAHDVNLVHAIDQLFAKEEQSVDDLLNSFSHLKSTGINGPVNGHNFPMNGSHIQETQTGISNEVEIQCQSDGEDSLQEEELGAGTTLAPSLFRTSEERTGLLTKFDNFVDDDVSDLSSASDEENTPDYCKSESSSAVSFFNNISERDPLPGEASSDIYTDRTERNVKEPCGQDYQAYFRDCRTGNDSFSHSGRESETVVERFQLDDDFDYDNVKCSPKFGLAFLRQRNNDTNSQAENTSQANSTE